MLHYHNDQIELVERLRALADRIERGEEFMDSLKATKKVNCATRVTETVYTIKTLKGE